jgi:hypothetical protein
MSNHCNDALQKIIIPTLYMLKKVLTKLQTLLFSDIQSKDKAPLVRNFLKP